MKRFQKYTGSIIWILALAILFFMETGSGDLSFCIFKSIGFDACWGCGLGHSIHYALHLDLVKSFKEHVLGIPTTLVLFSAIIKPHLPPKIKST